MPERRVGQPEPVYYPEILDEVLYLQPLNYQHIFIDHEHCSLRLARHSAFPDRASFSVAVQPSGKPDFPGDFNVVLEHPTAEATIFFNLLTKGEGRTDFERCLPGGIMRRPDVPTKRMLTESGQTRLLEALRYGALRGYFGEMGYVKSLFIDRSKHQLMTLFDNDCSDEVPPPGWSIKHRRKSLRLRGIYPE
jgi:hypothetical protein